MKRKRKKEKNMPEEKLQGHKGVDDGCNGKMGR